jgi:hypothetical protein
VGRVWYKVRKLPGVISGHDRALCADRGADDEITMRCLRVSQEVLVRSAEGALTVRYLQEGSTQCRVVYNTHRPANEHPHAANCRALPSLAQLSAVVSPQRKQKFWEELTSRVLLIRPGSHRKPLQAFFVAAGTS